MVGGGSVWGVDIGQAVLKAVKVQKVDGILTVAAFDYIEYEETVDDRDLQIRTALEELINRHRIKGRRDRILVSVPGRAAFSRFINLPPVEKKRIPEIVEYEARQQIPFPIDEVVWDYQIIDKDYSPGEEVEVGLFATKGEVVNAFLANLLAVGLSVEVVQTAPLALYNFVQYDQNPAKPLVVVDIGAHSTDMVIIDGAHFWIRNLPVAGNDITRTLEKKFGIPFDEAEKLKKRFGQTKQASEVFEVIKPTLRDLVVEIQRTIGFYKSQYQETKLDDILLLGNCLKLTGLQKFMAKNMQYGVKHLSGMRNIAISSSIDATVLEQNLSGFAVALGLGVQGMKAGAITVDLLPEPLAKKRELLRKKPFIVGSAVVVLFLILSMWGVAYRTKAKLAKGEKEALLVKTLTDADVAVKIAKDRSAIIAKIDVLKQIGVRRGLWTDILPQLVKVTPKEIRITSIQSDWVDAAVLKQTAGGVVIEDRRTPTGWGLPMDPGRPGLPNPAEQAPPPEEPAVGKVMRIRLECQLMEPDRGVGFVRTAFRDKLAETPLFKEVQIYDKRDEIIGTPTRVREERPRTHEPGLFPGRLLGRPDVGGGEEEEGVSKKVLSFKVQLGISSIEEKKAREAKTSADTAALSP